MLHVVETGDIAYVYTSLIDSKEIVSAVPLHKKTMRRPFKNIEYSAAYLGYKASPRFREVVTRNTMLFNRNNYSDEETYLNALRSMLEVLPGDKSKLFFGGDFTSLDSLSCIIKVAGELSFKTWVIASTDRSLLNNYCLNIMLSDVEIPKNVWLYEIAAEQDENEPILHDLPTITYQLQDKEESVEDELLQFPKVYKNFSIKLCQKK